MTKKQGSGFMSPQAFVRAADASPAEQDAADREMVSHLVRLTKRQKADLTYIADHTPRASVSSLIRDGIDMLIEARMKDLAGR